MRHRTQRWFVMPLLLVSLVGCGRSDEPDTTQSRWIELLKQNGTPVERAFANGEFRHGDSVDSLLERHPTNLVVPHPPYTTIFYTDRASPSGLSRDMRVVVKHGKLMYAKTELERAPRYFVEVHFFDDPAWLATREYIDSLQSGIEKTVQDKLKAFIAVAGGAAISRK